MTAASERLEPTWDPRCGEMREAGYYAHRRRGERPSVACSNARWGAADVKQMRAETANLKPPLSPELPGEEWRDVAGAPLHQVSSEGRVRAHFTADAPAAKAGASWCQCSRAARSSTVAAPRCNTPVIAPTMTGQRGRVGVACCVKWPPGRLWTGSSSYRSASPRFGPHRLMWPLPMTVAATTHVLGRN